jgi:hypothetical protein
VQLQLQIHALEWKQGILITTKIITETGHTTITWFEVPFLSVFRFFLHEFIQSKYIYTHSIFFKKIKKSHLLVDNFDYVCLRGLPCFDSIGHQLFAICMSSLCFCMTKTFSMPLTSITQLNLLDKNPRHIERADEIHFIALHDAYLCSNY